MKFILSLLSFCLLSTFCSAQFKHRVLDEEGQPMNYAIHSPRSKIPLFLTADKSTKSINPFNGIPSDPLGTIVFLEGATTVSVSTRLKKDSLSYYRYSIIENDTAVLVSNALLTKVDFAWPKRSDFPGYLTMNLGISNIANKKLTVKIYRSPDESHVTTVIIYNKVVEEAIKFAALDYLLKPVSIQELVLAVNKAKEKLIAKEKNKQLNFLLNHLQKGETSPTKIALPQLHEIRYVSVNEIIRCEADNSYTFFYLINHDRILVSRSIKEYTDLLKPLGFLRTHQSHLVNKIFVKSWIKEDGGVLLLTNGDKIPVSRPNKEVVQNTLNQSLR